MKTKLFIASLFFQTIAFGQNLVPNNSFEVLFSKPCSWNVEENIFMQSTISAWRQPTHGTPDIFTMDVPQTCAVHCLSVGRESFGKQVPRSGRSMAGISCYSRFGCSGTYYTTNYREYLQVRLREPLLPDKVYYAEMYVSRAEKRDLAVNNLGMAFTNSQFTNFSTCGPLGIIPQVNSIEIISDTVNWIKVCDTFSVQTEANYLTIGNFYSNSNTSRIWLPGNNAEPGASYYFVDDIYVQEFCQTRKFYDTIGKNNRNNSLKLDSYVPKATYLWNDGKTTGDNEINQPGIYWVDITLGNCTKRDTFFIASLFPPVFLGTDTAICEGSSVTLNATIANATYQWQDGSLNPVFRVVNPGVYWVDVTVNDYTTRDSIDIKVKALPKVDLGVDKILCQNDSLTLDVTMNDASYTWQNGFSTPAILVSEPGIYWVKINVANCISSDTLLVTRQAIQKPNLGRDTSICLGDTLTLQADNFYNNYLWSNNTTDRVINVSAPGLYWLRISENSCFSADTITISANSTNCDCKIYIPTAFTPNHDGINELMKPFFFDCLIKEFEFTIFDRWGQKAYYSTDYHVGWNGKKANEELSSGVFAYILKYRSENDRTLKILKGTFLLVR